MKVSDGGRLYEETTKTYENRRIVLPAFLRDMLGRHIKDHVETDERAFVFRAPTGGPLRHQNFYRRVWQPGIEAAGILPGFRIHDLRHTCAALLISQGAHIKAVQNHLGHSSIQVTLDHYGHLYEADLEQLAAGLDATYRRAGESGNDEVSKISRNCQTSPGTPVKDQAELVSTISRNCVNDQVEPESPASPGPRH